MPARKQWPACRRKLTKTIDVPADGEETTSVKFVRYQYTVKRKQHVDIVLYVKTPRSSSH